MVAPAPPGLLFKLLIIGDALRRVIELLQCLMVMYAAGLALQMLLPWPMVVTTMSLK